MINLFISEMKDIVKTYLNKAKATALQVESNNKRFAPEYAEKENANVMQKAIADYEYTKKSINDVFEQVKGFLAMANFPSVEDLTADRLLFSKETSIHLTNTEVKSYVERYNNNFTMLRLIKDWIATQETDEYNDISEMIKLPLDLLKVYKQFAESALSMVDTIYNDSANFNELQLNSFADENFSHSLFEVIGTGDTLKDNSMKRVPESAKHCFDDITLKLDNDSQIHFGL